MKLASKSNGLNAMIVIIAGGALDAIATELIDKGKDFNFRGNGFEHLLSVAIVGGIITLAAWYRSRHVTHTHYREASKVAYGNQVGTGKVVNGNTGKDAGKDTTK